MSRLNEVRFNRESTIFMTSGSDGFRVFYIDPLMQMYHVTTQHIGAGNVLLAEISKNSNLIVIVCENSADSFMLWDAESQKVRRVVCFNGDVITNLKFLGDKLIVVRKTKVHIWSFVPELESVYEYEARSGDKGVIAVNSSLSAQKMAFLGLGKVGSVQIVDFGHSEHTQVSPNIIPAHKHEVTCIALNSDGSKVATASEHGTIIRLFNTTTKEKLLELRRGQDPARVFSISFSPDSSALCVTSDKGTVHIFAILKSSLNQRSALPNVGGIVSSHTDAQWSPVKFTVPAELACVCTFLKNKRSTVVALCVDGSYHMYRFSLDPASCKAEAYEKFLELGDSMEM